MRHRHHVVLDLQNNAFFAIIYARSLYEAADAPARCKDVPGMAELRKFLLYYAVTAVTALLILLIQHIIAILGGLYVVMGL